MNTDLFHAYVIGGHREIARKHISALLDPYKVLVAGNPNLLVSEHVTFTIDDARTLKSWQELAPLGGSRKVYIVYTDFITREAENALLKTLEEPVAGTHIIIAIPKPDMLLPTFLSRVRLVTPIQTETLSDVAQKFITVGIAERLAAVSKMIEKGDDEDASAQVREKAIVFLGELERELSKNIEENALKLEQLLELKKYLYIPGASVRMILETIALTI